MTTYLLIYLLVVEGYMFYFEGVREREEVL